MVAASLTTHPTWPELSAYVRQEEWRFFVKKPADEGVLRRFLDMRIACALCCRPIQPVRQGRGCGLYLAFTCPLTQRIGCSRSGGAKIETKRTRRALA